jgi:hypothetical protein
MTSVASILLGHRESALTAWPGALETFRQRYTVVHMRKDTARRLEFWMTETAFDSNLGHYQFWCALERAWDKGIVTQAQLDRAAELYWAKLAEWNTGSMMFAFRHPTESPP